jgi:hypothetical protein
MLRAVWIAALLAGCAAENVPPGSDEPSDFDPVDWSPDGKADVSGVPATFDHDAIVDNTVFTANAVDGDAVQSFLEHTPYGNRSWLADYTISGQRFSDRLVSIATADGIDPVMLLVRLQVESSIIGKTVQPSSSTLAHATGCGCPDSGGCSASLSGFENQIQCAADTYSKGFADSQHGTSQWRSNHAAKTLDGITVTPRYDATASIYAYTPWVLVNRGGAWLTWNVTRLYLKQFDSAGTLHLP